MYTASLPLEMSHSAPVGTDSCEVQSDPCCETYEAISALYAKHSAHFQEVAAANRLEAAVLSLDYAAIFRKLDGVDAWPDAELSKVLKVFSSRELVHRVCR